VQAFADLFGAKIQDVLNSFNGTNGATLFSLPCYNHAISEGGSWFSLKTTAGLSEDDALQLFLNDTTTFTDLTDSCTNGFDTCTSTGTKCNGV